MTSIAILEAVNTSYVPFNGQQIITAMAAGVAYVAMKPIVENLGMSWGTQQQKLMKQLDKFNCIHMNMVAADGKLRKLLCLPLKKLNGWLFSINPEKVRADIRDKLIKYQEECFTVLHDYWTKGKAENPRGNADKTTTDDRTPLRGLVNRIMGKTGIHYQPLYKMIHREFGVKHIDELTSRQVTEAMEFLAGKALEGELIGKQEELPAPKLDINFPISWFSENAPYAIIRQQCGDTVALDRSALVECSPAYKLIDILTKAGYDVSAVRAELKALRHLMAEQSWALKEIASFAAIRDRACHSIKL
ncbi:phage antirepressor N-terminal domain-containing protein [Salmonella enterica]|nr:phage antirepressor N-terminal domain-containing protein [Salmonella enterica]EJB9183745.1 phage antirepressor N-terminal domain-containing protein [Salmonella enterica]EJC0848885.1 phage antirepressor N-terminal domain-containing protein [Salmonella enterica]